MRIELNMVFSRITPLVVASAVLLLAAPQAHAADPPLSTGQLVAGQHFKIDPVSDGVITVGAAGFSGILGMVLGTGEIRATTPGPTTALLGFDRDAVTQTIDPNAATYSDIGLYAGVSFAVIDPLLSVLRDGPDAGLVDAVMYAESLSLTLMLTDITKIAVRRPRPIDYVNCPSVAGVPAPPACLANTDNQLSFFSGHASTLGAMTGTATYLAFRRSPHSARPWITLGVGTLLTAFVDFERIRSGAHFPTDVITGSMAGAAIGILVPHLHRHTEEPPPVWIGVEPAPGGGSLSLQGLF
jgi:membrane-associated phospholipid phosphatase